MKRLTDNQCVRSHEETQMSAEWEQNLFKMMSKKNIAIIAGVAIVRCERIFWIPTEPPKNKASMTLDVVLGNFVPQSAWKQQCNWIVPAANQLQHR